MTVLVDSQVSNRCPWATCLVFSRRGSYEIANDLLGSDFYNECLSIFVNIYLNCSVLFLDFVRDLTCLFISA